MVANERRFSMTNLRRLSVVSLSLAVKNMDQREARAALNQSKPADVPPG